MHFAIVMADGIGSQLYHWIFSAVFLQYLVAFLFAFMFPITSAAIINYLERKVMAWMQDRKGPLHVGPHGSLQLLADIGKMFTKEDVHAAQTDKAIFLLAPSAFIAPVIASFAVLPFSPFLGLPGTALATGIISLKEIMTFQNTWKDTGIGILDFIFKGFTPWAWFILVQPLMLLIYYVCGLAETNRAPFDLPEAESELVAGFLTEYSGIRWAMFFLGEYGNMTIVSAITTSLFLGGWSGPGVGFLTAPGMAFGWQLFGNILGVIYFVTKVYLLCVLFIWIRSTLPRLRADQLMQFAWLMLIPATLGNILLTGLLYLVVSGLGLSNLAFLIVTGAINWLLLIGFIRLVGRATVATTRRAQAPAIRARARQAALAQVAGQAGASGVDR